MARSIFYIKEYSVVLLPKNSANDGRSGPKHVIRFLAFNDQTLRFNGWNKVEYSCIKGGSKCGSLPRALRTCRRVCIRSRQTEIFPDWADVQCTSYSRLSLRHRLDEGKISCLILICPVKEYWRVDISLFIVIFLRRKVQFRICLFVLQHVQFTGQLSSYNRLCFVRIQQAASSTVALSLWRLCCASCLKQQLRAFADPLIQWYSTFFIFFLFAYLQM
jgi:hypothetical protein